MKCALQGPQSTAPAAKHYDYRYDTAAIIVRLLLLLLLLFFASLNIFDACGIFF